MSVQLHSRPASARSGVLASMLSRKASRRWPGAWPEVGRLVVGMACSIGFPAARIATRLPVPCHEPRGRSGVAFRGEGAGDAR
jgi:hypothetical protein